MLKRTFSNQRGTLKDIFLNFYEDAAAKNPKLKCEEVVQREFSSLELFDEIKSTLDVYKNNIMLESEGKALDEAQEYWHYGALLDMDSLLLFFGEAGIFSVERLAGSLCKLNECIDNKKHQLLHKYCSERVHDKMTDFCFLYSHFPTLKKALKILKYLKGYFTERKNESKINALALKYIKILSILYRENLTSLDKYAAKVAEEIFDKNYGLRNFLTIEDLQDVADWAEEQSQNVGETLAKLDKAASKNKTSAELKKSLQKTLKTLSSLEDEILLVYAFSTENEEENI